MKLLKLTVGEEILHARLLEDEAPKTCAAFEGVAPFSSALFSANVCFGEFTFAAPLPNLLETENVREDTHVGQVAWYPDWQCVCVFTQEMQQFGATAQFAEICEEDLPVFQDLAEFLWHEQGIPVTVEVVEEGAETPEPDDAPGWRGFGREGLPEGAKALLDDLDEQMEYLWDERPGELSQMVARNATTAREMAVWAYAWGELVNLGDMLISISDIARSGRGDAVTLALAAAEQCRFFAGVFDSSAHMPSVANTLRRSAEAIELAQTHEQLLAVLRPVQVWCAQMGFWASAELPWDSACDVVHMEWNPELPDPNWPDDVFDGDDLVYALEGDDLVLLDGEPEDEDAPKKGKKAKKAKKAKKGKKAKRGKDGKKKAKKGKKK